MQSRKLCAIGLTLCCMLAGCGRDTASDGGTSSVDTETTAAVSTETSVTTTAAATTSITITTVTTATDASVDGEAVATDSYQTYTSVLGCQLLVPTSWTGTSGVSGTTLTGTECAFEPTSQNGDSLTLVIETEAEDTEAFQQVDAESIEEAWSAYFEDVTVTDWETLTVSGYAAYRFQFSGKLEDAEVILEQLVVNCEGREAGAYQYAFTYTNITGGTAPYSGTLDNYFWLTD